MSVAASARVRCCSAPAPNCSLDSVRIRSRTAAQGLERPLHCLPPRVHACVEMNHPWYCRRPRRLCQGTWPLVRASSPAPNRPSNRVRHVSCALMDNHGHHHSFVALASSAGVESHWPGPFNRLQTCCVALVPRSRPNHGEIRCLARHRSPGLDRRSFAHQVEDSARPAGPRGRAGAPGCSAGALRPCTAVLTLEPSPVSRCGVIVARSAFRDRSVTTMSES